MSFRPCATGCGAYLASFDGHNLCLTCLGRYHAKAALMDASCIHFKRMTIVTLRSRLSYARGRPVLPTQPSSTCRESASAALVKDWGDLRITVRDAPAGKPPRKSCPSKRGPIELPKHDTRSSRGEHSVSFGAPEEDRMSIAASEEGLPSAEANDSAKPPSTVGAAQSEADAELASGIRAEVSNAPSPERSQLNDWFLGAKGDVPPCPAPVPFFPGVHEEPPIWLAHVRVPSSSPPLLVGHPG
ncbi:hypothetical protein M9458_012839, partial [Cirrhinus mrigala]